MRVSGRLLASVFEMLDEQDFGGMSTLQVNDLGPVANHRDAIRAAARLQLAAQMQSVLSQRVAMPLNSLIPAK